jgi:hypothetical protein
VEGGLGGGFDAVGVEVAGAGEEVADDALGVGEPAGQDLVEGGASGWGRRTSPFRPFQSSRWRVPRGDAEARDHTLKGTGRGDGVHLGRAEKTWRLIPQEARSPIAWSSLASGNGA